MKIMQFINALSCSPDVSCWLAHSRHLRILHVFDRACNLINERREVLSIVTPQIGNGPFNLVISRLRKSFRRIPDGNSSRQTSEVSFNRLNLQSPVSNSPLHLTIGNLVINTTDAKLWSPRPDWERLHGKRHDIANQLKKLPITIYRVRGLDTPVANTRLDYSTTTINPKPPITNYYSPIFQFSNSLLSSLTIADLPSSLTAVQKLAGLD